MSSLRRLANQKASLNKGLRMRLPPNSSAFCAASKGWGLEVGGVSFWLPAKLALAGTEGTIGGEQGLVELGAMDALNGPFQTSCRRARPLGPRKQSAPSEKRPGPLMRLPIFGEMGRKWRGSGGGPRCWDGRRSCLNSPSLTFALDHSGHDSGRCPMFIFYFSCSAG